MLRYLRDSIDGQPKENAFEVTDARTGERTGLCVIYTGLYPNLFPVRPHLIRIRIEGEPESYERLMGAALARSYDIARKLKLPARAFVECPPENEELFQLLLDIGMKNNDGLLRMQLDDLRSYDTALPMGTSIFEDDLSDLQEQNYFLERYNQLMREGVDRSWLETYVDHENFRRFLCVNASGLVSEVICWTDGGTGVIDFVQTSRKWRSRGYAKYILSRACTYLREKGCPYVQCVLRAKWPYALKSFESVGFYQKDLIMRYPGIDIDV